MYKIAVIGGADSVIGFKALGLATYPVDSPESAKKALRA
ncbi:MAG: V-type ATP synthase subunit F, partial [Oscillospiraceae bacterium]|nr:V-type ATP synthase subunit F [Oscillospiraceae bacterium]MBR2879882.1 V-type ATP synthase subunit F [Oscillospiraceae bacterium]